MTHATLEQLTLHPDALEEFVEAARWYEAEVVGLGARFQAAVEAVLEAVLEQPRTGSPLLLAGRATPYRIRRARRFPYAVVYRELGNGVLVVAIAHARRRPSYGLERDE